MKKIIFSIVTFLFLVIPINTLASEEGITSFYIDATVLGNGDVNVKELIVLNGSFNGFERIINYKNNKLSSFDGSILSFKGSDIYNASDIELVSVKDITIDSNTTFSYIHHNGEVKKAAVHGGIIEILPDKVTVLAEVAEWPEEIDVNRANEAKIRAERRLATKDADLDVARAEMALKRSLARLDAAD